MKPLMLEEVIEAFEGTVDRSVPPVSVSAISTDSRAVEPGNLFIAIEGDRFDGHRFVGAAFAAGALAAVVRDDYELPLPRRGAKHKPVFSPESLLIRVDHPVEALGTKRLAQRPVHLDAGEGRALIVDSSWRPNVRGGA